MSSPINIEDRNLLRGRFGAHTSAAFRSVADRLLDLPESRKVWFRHIAAELDTRGISTLNEASDEIVDEITKRQS
jgi:hypothetical protein